MPEVAQLGGVGVFHLMNDRLMRSRGLAGNHCLFVLELAGRVDVARLDVRLARAVGAVPELRFRLSQRLLQRPEWIIDHGSPDPSVEVHEDMRRAPLAPGATFGEPRCAPLPPMLEERLSARLDGDRPWAIDVLRGPERDTILFRWFHPLTDGKGAERLVRWLGSGSGDEPEDPPPEAERFEASTRPLAGLDHDARVALTRAYNSFVLDLGRTPIMSLDSVERERGVGRRGGRAGLRAAIGALMASGSRAGSAATRILRIVLSADETRAFDKRVRQRAKLAESSVLIHAAARVLDRALVQRGFAPPLHVIPVPLSLDPKTGCRRILGNNLTMMLLTLDRDDLRDEARAYSRLAEQQRAIVRQKLDVGMLAALDFASYLPSAPYRWVADKPFHGEMASLIFSNPGAVSIESFAGVPVRDAYPLPAVVLPPGFQVIFSRFQGRLSAVVVFAEQALGADLAVRMAEALKAELLA